MTEREGLLNPFYQLKKWIVETASFDIHIITDLNLYGTDYQNGNLKGFYNLRIYVLHRDNYTCQKCKNKSKDYRLECHHTVFRSNGGTDRTDNLIVPMQNLALQAA